MAKQRSLKPFFIALIAIVAVFFLVMAWLEKQEGITVSKPIPAGGADYCKVAPAFPKKFGLRMPYGVDLRQQGYMGLAIIEGNPGGKTLRLPEWEQAGYLGPHAFDQSGNIYVAPTPNVNIDFNPPEKQNIVYIVESQTGEMKKLIELPWASPPTANNPFGLVGLTYDCDTESLYAASLAGSTFREEKGRIFRIDLKRRKVEDQLEGVDALGLGVFNGSSGKRLYFASARESEVYSIGLKDSGNFRDDKRLEFSLAAGSQGSFDKGHRIQFPGPDQMTVKAIEFSYSLIAASDPRRNIYSYVYDPQKDTWSLSGVQGASY
jgi:hypothetical protein